MRSAPSPAGEEQLLPFGRTERLSTRTETSDVAFSRSPRSDAMERVLEAFRLRPMTCDEVMEATGLMHQTASAVVNALMRQGIIAWTGEKRMTMSQRPARVWRYEPDPIRRVRVSSSRPTRRQLEWRIDSAIRLMTSGELVTKTEIIKILKGENE